MRSNKRIPNRRRNLLRFCNMSAPMEKVGGFIRGSFKLTRERTTHIFGRFMFPIENDTLFNNFKLLLLNKCSSTCEYLQ